MEHAWYTPMARTTDKQGIPKAIRLVWDSLDSHLDASLGPVHKKACCNRAVGSPAFHRQCVREYVEVLDALTKLL